MSTDVLKTKRPIGAILLMIYVVWEIFAVIFDYVEISNLCMSPLQLISVAAIVILWFVKKRGAVLLIPFGLMAITYIVNIYFVSTGTYYAYFPLDDSSIANAMRFEYFCNIFVIFIDFAISVNIILLLISNTRLFSSKGNKNISKYALLILVIIRLLIFLFYYLAADLDILIYMPLDCAAYFLLTPFLYYIGLLLCGFQIAGVKNKVQTENEQLNIA